MRIAILGTGRVGGVLGRRWAQQGHTVIFGSRQPGSPKVTELVQSAGQNASAASQAEAVEAAEVVVLAVPWRSAEEIVHSIPGWNGKTLVDCTNPIAEGRRRLSLGTTTSAAEEIARWASGARVVKAFNMVGSSTMENPRYGDTNANLFICGDDAEAKQAVNGLAASLGFAVIDAGDLSSARYLEPLAMLWIHLAYNQGFGREIAFQLLKR
jgi:hypothetical protein